MPVLRKRYSDYKHSSQVVHIFPSLYLQTMDFQKVFIECCEEFKFNVLAKFKEHNNFRVSADDVVKTVQNHPIHRRIFESCFKEGELTLLRQAYKVFGVGTIRINQHRDISLVAPLMYVTTPGEHGDLDRGDLVIPICKAVPFTELPEDQSFQVFVPSSCDDLGRTDNIVTLSYLLPFFDPHVLPEERLTGYSISTGRGNKFVSVKAGHGLNIGDFLVVRGKSYKIMDIHPEDIFAAVPESRNMIYVDKSFECNVKNQAFRFRKMVYLHGSLQTLPCTAFVTFRGLSIKFKEKNKNKHGAMELTLSCAVFNSSGYFTRSLAIPEEDIS